jgi:hypothetical protein
MLARNLGTARRIAATVRQPVRRLMVAVRMEIRSHGMDAARTAIAVK